MTSKTEWISAKILFFETTQHNYVIKILTNTETPSRKIYVTLSTSSYHRHRFLPDIIENSKADNLKRNVE